MSEVSTFLSWSEPEKLEWDCISRLLYRGFCRTSGTLNEEIKKERGIIAKLMYHKEREEVDRISKQQIERYAAAEHAAEVLAARRVKQEANYEADRVKRLKEKTDAG